MRSMQGVGLLFGAALLSMQAHAGEMIQVAIWDYTDNGYVLSIEDSDEHEYPLQATIGSSGQLQVNRQLVGSTSQVLVCARYRPDANTAWNQKCHIVSGNKGSVQWQDGIVLSFITSDLTGTPPLPYSSGSAPAYAAANMSCPEGTVLECWTFTIDITELQCVWDPFWMHTMCYPVTHTEEIEQCTCVDDNEDPEDPEECPPAEFELSW